MLILLSLLACTTGASTQSTNEHTNQAAPTTTPSTSDDPQAIIDSAQALLDKIPGLEDPAVQIVGNSITITGTAEDPSVITQATTAVQDATGFEKINNQIDLSLNLQDRTRGAANRLTVRAQEWLAYLPVIPIALFILIIFATFSWLVGKWQWPFTHFTPNLFLQEILQKLAQSLIVLFGVLLALEVLDAMALVGGVLGAAGVAGIAIGFAFKDLIENYIASILLSLRQPFKPRDHVLIDGHEGIVTFMNSRTTVLTTFDGNIIRIPNAVVFKTTLINYTADSRRRFDFTVGVGNDVDLTCAIELGIKTMTDTPGVMQDPKPSALISLIGDSNITLQFFAWVDQSTASFAKVKSNTMQNVKVKFDQNEIDMPEPIYKIRIENKGDGAALLTRQPTQTAPSTPSSPSPQHHPMSSAPSDISRDDTILDMANQAAQEQADDNLLNENAPQE